jgi:hypothetical protein
VVDWGMLEQTECIKKSRWNGRISILLNFKAGNTLVGLVQGFARRHKNGKIEVKVHQNPDHTSF